MNEEKTEDLQQPQIPGGFRYKTAFHVSDSKGFTIRNTSEQNKLPIEKRKKNMIERKRPFNFILKSSYTYDHEETLKYQTNNVCMREQTRCKFWLSENTVIYSFLGHYIYILVLFHCHYCGWLHISLVILVISVEIYWF